VILTTLWGSPAKSCLILFLTMFIKKVYFLRICIIRFKNILILYVLIVLHDQKIFIFYFFAYEHPKNAEFYAGFKSDTVKEGDKQSTMLNYFGL
jgi:hypothetical protein